jgi:hypothetical protein
MPNIWKVTAKDKDGKPVESAPGMYHFIARGPIDPNIVKQHIQQILNVRREREWYASGGHEGGVDPGYVVDKIEPVGDSEQTEENIGEWRPPERVAPVTLGKSFEETDIDAGRR